MSAYTEPRELPIQDLGRREGDESHPKPQIFNNILQCFKADKQFIYEHKIHYIVHSIYQFKLITQDEFIHQMFRGPRTNCA